VSAVFLKSTCNIQGAGRRESLYYMRDVATNLRWDFFTTERGRSRP